MLSNGGKTMLFDPKESWQRRIEGSYVGLWLPSKKQASKKRPKRKKVVRR